MRYAICAAILMIAAGLAVGIQEERNGPEKCRQKYPGQPELIEQCIGQPGVTWLYLIGFGWVPFGVATWLAYHIGKAGDKPPVLPR